MEQAAETPAADIERMKAERHAELLKAEGDAIVLRAIVQDTLWMAQRYADGRMTYAVGMYNAAAKVAHDRFGIDVTYAKDGMFDANPQFNGE